MVMERWSFLDALYMTLLALTTVGFREVRPLDTSGKILTLTLILMGVTLVIITLSLFAASIAEGGFGQRSKRRKMSRRIGAMKDHFIICAYGRVGKTVARELEVEGTPLVIIESNEDLEDELVQAGIAHVIADPTSEAVLREAGIHRAKGLICAVDSDTTNVYITLTARSLNPNIFIVARASEENGAEQLYRAGADRVLSPYVTTGRHMAYLASKPRVVDYMDVGPEKAVDIRLEELRVEPGSDLVNRSVATACEEKVPLALRRASGDLVAPPDSDLKLEPGDILVLLERR